MRMVTVALEKRVKVLEEKVKSLDLASAARARLRQMIMDGLNSGQGTIADADYWEKKRTLIRTHR